MRRTKSTPYHLLLKYARSPAPGKPSAFLQRDLSVVEVPAQHSQFGAELTAKASAARRWVPTLPNTRGPERCRGQRFVGASWLLSSLRGFSEIGLSPKAGSPKQKVRSFLGS